MRVFAFAIICARWECRWYSRAVAARVFKSLSSSPIPTATISKFIGVSTKSEAIERVRPPEERGGAATLEDAVANPVRGQVPVLADPSLLKRHS